MAARQPQFNQTVLIDTAPLPPSIPAVTEVGTSSAPLLSASFFIGARCKPYGDDFMQCKTENPGKGEFECLKEGRRVTRCARSVFSPSFDLQVNAKQIPRLNCILLCQITPIHDKSQLTIWDFYSIEDVNKHCLAEFRKHWTCLDNNNQQLWHCRPAERILNKCVFDNLKLEKVIPDTPEGETPVHLREKQIYSQN
ncbi:NADH-ubiquinone oxidoreductase 20.8 kDa subunit [Golovinomyces cichoracearum]|uniref:NADH-ubiquinone oxidoreductase n=1 Tax=Golovinomyces cichoracearum TaxID=62708 RepID=A0A420HW68_9PEZI|nr:NADH-ubiquinone oxidoreductase 20.8 kDa subunit [Golovinomyces cichoracearum]RKF61693.1 NADH-ubiquinone oxidoreductase 20.8 kDa subunit [Golovinomyces cichoracearum]